MTAVAEAQVSGGTVVRVETDADGNAKYEAHMTKADGTPVTVYVDANYNFVSTQTTAQRVSTMEGPQRAAPPWRDRLVTSPATC